MAHKFHTEKHLKKRHFIGKDHIHSKERMAALKEEEKPVIDEKTEKVNQVVEPAKQTAEIKPTPITDVSPMPTVTPQRTFQFAKKKNVFEKLKDKFQKLMKHFKK